MINALNLSLPAESISQTAQLPKVSLGKINRQYSKFLTSDKNLSVWLRMSKDVLPQAIDDLETFLVSHAEHESLRGGFLKTVLDNSKVIISFFI